MTASNVLGKNNTLIAAGGVQKILSGLVDGRVKVMADTYTMNSETSGSTIKMGGAIPTGANILLIALSASAAVASLTISIGDSNSATRYVSASTACQTALVPVLYTPQAYVIGTNTGDTQILLTTGGASLASSGTIQVLVFYSLD